MSVISGLVEAFTTASLEDAIRGGLISFEGEADRDDDGDDDDDDPKKSSRPMISDVSLRSC